MLNEKLQQVYNEYYPQFLDTMKGSNLSRHNQIITNRQSDILHQLRNLQNYFILEKPLQIKKEQITIYDYTLTFIVKMKDIKKVTIESLELNTIIYSETFEEGVDSFEKTIECTGSEIIPHTKYLLSVVDYAGYEYKKGYPHNQVQNGDEYDVDEGLDFIGKLYNIPRYHHIIVPETKYPSTLPPYHNDELEDDYYYMERIREYLKKYNTIPLPILELWKNYGIMAKMVNRKVKIHQQNIDDMQTPTWDIGEVYMRTRIWFNSCVYDIYCEYDDFPSNLNKPTTSELETIFTNTLPITKLNKLNIQIIKELGDEKFDMKNHYIIKIGETVIRSDIEWNNLAIYGELYMDTDTGELLLMESENKYLVCLDAASNFLEIDAHDEEVGKISISSDTGDIQVVAE